jgi:Amino acid permease
MGEAGRVPHQTAVADPLTPVSATPAPRGAQNLDRRLGTFDAAAIIVSNVIGSGIFLTPAIIAALIPQPGLMIGAWLTGGVLAFAGAMAYAELAALRPKAGGEYVYLREAFGPPSSQDGRHSSRGFQVRSPRAPSASRHRSSASCPSPAIDGRSCRHLSVP